jgi:hypothetical protein
MALAMPKAAPAARQAADDGGLPRTLELRDAREMAFHKSEERERQQCNGDGNDERLMGGRGQHLRKERDHPPDDIGAGDRERAA